MKFSGSHYKGLHKGYLFTDKELYIFRKYIEEQKCDIFPKIHIVRRIGSPSLYATVWEIRILDLPLAVKIQKDLNKTLSEIDIHKYLNDYPDHFLQLYDDIYCEEIRLNNEGVFDGQFMFLELAIADLSQYISLTNVSENQLIKFIGDVYDSIYILGKSQIFHGDLHIGNVFIVSRNNEIKAVVGDFGESFGNDSITSHTSDIYKFTTSLLEFLNTTNKYPKVKEKLKSIIKATNKLTGKLENEYDVLLSNDDANVDEFFDIKVGETIRSLKNILFS